MSIHALIWAVMSVPLCSRETGFEANYWLVTSSIMPEIKLQHIISVSNEDKVHYNISFTNEVPIFWHIFWRRWPCDEQFVHLSAWLFVRPSVKCLNCEKVKETSAHMHLVLWYEEWLVGCSLLPEIFGNIYPLPSKMAINFQSIFVHSTSGIICLAKKVYLLLIGSPLQAFR